MTYTILEQCCDTIHTLGRVDFDITYNQWIYFSLSLLDNNNDCTKNIEQFTDHMIKHIIDGIDITEDYEDNYEPPHWQWSLTNLGKDKFTENLKRYYCSPIIGNWKYVNIKIPHWDGEENADFWAKIEFDNSPSLFDLLYLTHKISIENNNDSAASIFYPSYNGSYSLKGLSTTSELTCEFDYS